MEKKKFVVYDPVGEILIIADSAKEAVEAAFTYDGYGFEFERDGSGRMVGRGSSRHIGNSPFIYNSESDFELVPTSDLVDDKEAIEDVANRIIDRHGSDAHARLPVRIERQAEVKSLGELCELLNDGLLLDGQFSNIKFTAGEIDMSALPTFGGTEPSDTTGVWSWDAESVLLDTGSEPAYEVVSLAAWLMMKADVTGSVEVRAGVWLCTDEHMESEQKSWEKGDLSKSVDFSGAPYWLSANDGALEPVHDEDDLVKRL